MEMQLGKYTAGIKANITNLNGIEALQGWATG